MLLYVILRWLMVLFWRTGFDRPGALRWARAAPLKTHEATPHLSQRSGQVKGT
jgi:hypothetical protein